MRTVKKILIFTSAVVIFAGLSGCSFHSFGNGHGHGHGNGPDMIKMKSNKGGTKIMVK